MDGNGRIGRLLIPLILCAAQRLPQPLLYLSAYFERNRQEYMDRLLAVSQRGEWSEWIAFFVRGVIEQATDAIHRARAVLALRDEYRRKTHSARSSALLPKLVDQLFVLPLITVPQAAKHLGVTQAAARAIVERLVAQGILEETGDLKRNRTFLAPKILEIIEKE
jgi:cell filamentation protein, protein adenylyltransferase